MSDGRISKPDKDFSKEVDKAIPEAEGIAKSNLLGAIEKLTLLEKQTRQASDLASTSRLLISIVTLCKDKRDWKQLNEQVIALSKKHGQLKQAITKMVQVVMEFIPETPSTEVKLSVIETLRTVTEGRIFVEVERARVTRMLSNLKKESGDKKAARDILCELQVETFGSMARREKTEFILEQVQLCIDTDDWTQAGILSRKIGTKYFARKPKLSPEEEEKQRKELEEKEKNRSVDDPPIEKPEDVTDLKLRYYEQQITLAKHDNNYLEVCKHYRSVLDTEAVEEHEAKLKAVLQRVIYFVILAQYNNEQSDLLQRIHRDSRNDMIETEQALLKLFTISELMRWPVIDKTYGSHLCRTDVFAREVPGAASKDSDEFKAHERYQDLRKRVIEHNVRVIAKYYTRIRLDRLCVLLDLKEEETEKYISELVVAKTIYARIDRPAGIITFAKQRGPDEVLNEWSSDMKSLLGLLERIDHLITKEEMMARIKPKAVT